MRVANFTYLDEKSILKLRITEGNKQKMVRSKENLPGPAPSFLVSMFYCNYPSHLLSFSLNFM